MKLLQDNVTHGLEWVIETQSLRGSLIHQLRNFFPTEKSVPAWWLQLVYKNFDYTFNWWIEVTSCEVSSSVQKEFSSFL